MPKTIESQTASFPKGGPALTLSPKSPASVHLDAVRGAAALAVFLGHWRALFFADYSQLQHPNILFKVLYALTGFGHSAVIVFFILSGFFISSSIFRSVKQGRWSWTWYAEQRLTRLYVVLIPALMLGAAWDFAGSHFLRSASVYLSSPDYQNILPPISQTLTLKAWFANLFFLQDIRSSVFGSNAPLWSLSYEFWYYLLFPIGLFALSRKSKAATRIGYLLAGLLILVFVGRDVALYFIVWLFGVLVCYCRPSRLTTSKIAGALFGLLFLISMAAPRFRLISNVVLSDFFVAVSFSALLYFMLNHEHRLTSTIYARAARSLSNISYSLYLLHIPALVFLNACIIRQSDRWQPTISHAVQAILIAGLVVLYTYGVWYVTEAKTSVVRDRVSALLNRGKQAR